MHLVIPFAAALSEPATQALGTLGLPHLERLLGAWAEVAPAPPEPAGTDEYSLSTPHERLLARLHGWPLVDGLLPFAAVEARQAGLAAPDGSGWGRLTLAHWRVGREEIHLLDPAELALGADESRAVFDVLRPLFADVGWALHPIGDLQALVQHPSLAALPTASLDRVIGRNVDFWLHDHPDLLALRRLQSEAQMLLYTHPLNDARAARDLPTVNSFWLSATGAAPHAGPRADDARGDARRRAAAPDDAPDDAPADALRPAADVRIDARLRAPTLAEDWSGWAEHWTALDAGPVHELLLAAAADPCCRLTLSGERLARSWVPATRPWWRRWAGPRRPGAQAVLATL